MYRDTINQNLEKVRVYHDAAEYGIICELEDLDNIIQNLNRFIKKSKVCSTGMRTEWGVVTGIPDVKTYGKNFYEWCLVAGYSADGRLSAEQGRIWTFQLQPNRHFKITPNGEIQEVYAFPDRKDIFYYFFLLKLNAYEGNDETRKKRECFFQQLTDSVGFPIEKLYTYGKEEERIPR